MFLPKIQPEPNHLIIRKHQTDENWGTYSKIIYFNFQNSSGHKNQKNSKELFQTEETLRPTTVQCHVRFGSGFFQPKNIMGTTDKPSKNIQWLTKYDVNSLSRGSDGDSFVLHFLLVSSRLFQNEDIWEKEEMLIPNQGIQFHRTEMSMPYAWGPQGMKDCEKYWTYAFKAASGSENGAMSLSFILQSL